MKSYSNRKFNKKKSLKGFIILIVFLLIFIIIALSYCIFINPILHSTIEFKSIQLANSSMNLAIKEVVSNKAIYDDLVKISCNTNGEITMVQAKMFEINQISDEVALKTEKIIKETGTKGVNVPLGNFSGISLLSGVGPNIKVKISPIEAVSCEFSSKFETAGINQTIHKIYVTIIAKVGVVIPFFHNSYSTEQKLLICENVIVGQVPEVYLYSDNLDTLLNFVPY